MKILKNILDGLHYMLLACSASEFADLYRSAMTEDGGVQGEHPAIKHPGMDALSQLMSDAGLEAGKDIRVLVFTRSVCGNNKFATHRGKECPTVGNADSLWQIVWSAAWKQAAEAELLVKASIRSMDGVWPDEFGHIWVGHGVSHWTQWEYSIIGGEKHFSYENPNYSASLYRRIEGENLIEKIGFFEGEGD